jgi:uncharacterized coiled-coil DUF342 family protein
LGSTPSHPRFGDSSHLDDSVLKTPNTGIFASGGSALRSTRKGDYLNMLDHDVEDMQLYEDVITELKGDLDQVSEERDALANQLDQITDERDSLLGACNNLGERLKKMEKEYDDKLTRLALEKEEVKQKLQTALDSANEVRYILHSYSWSLIERLVLQMYRQQEQQLRFLEDSQLTETNLRQQAERERDASTHKFTQLFESSRLSQIMKDSASDELAQFRSLEEELRSQIEVLEKVVALLMKHTPFTK